MTSVHICDLWMVRLLRRATCATTGIGRRFHRMQSTSNEGDEVFLSRSKKIGQPQHGYTLQDFQAIATRLRGADFACWIVARKEPLEMLLLLAHEAGVMLLPRQEKI